jgi:predicted nuclease of predicted toxin-antitoxin system
LDANVPRSALALLQRFQHDVEHVRDVGLGQAPDSQIAAQAQASHSVLVTRDLDFANIRNYPPERYPGIVVIRMPDHATASDILQVMESLLRQSEMVNQIPGHLVILERDRLRFRPALHDS